MGVDTVTTSKFEGYNFSIMSKALAILALALFVFPVQAYTQTNKAQHTSKGNNLSSPVAAVVPEHKDSPDLKSEDKKHVDADVRVISTPGKDSYDRAAFWVTVALAIFALLGIIAAFMTLGKLERQTVASEKASMAAESAVNLAAESTKHTLREMQLEQRAWVGVSSAMMVKLAPNERVTAMLGVKNTGKTFALHATLFQRLISLYGPLLQFPENIIQEPGITLFPGAEFFGQVEGGNTPLSQEEFNAIQSGRAFIYMYGTIRYEDVLGNPHRTQFALKYSPAVQNFQAYQGNNEAD